MKVLYEINIEKQLLISINCTVPPITDYKSQKGRFGAQTKLNSSLELKEEERFIWIQIHGILVWIRIRGSLPLTNGSETFYFRHETSRRQQKKIIKKKSFSAYYFLKVHLNTFSKIKSKKEVTKQYESKFFLLLLLDDRRIRFRSQIRIHNFD
jgi:hypothetical protein